MNMLIICKKVQGIFVHIMLRFMVLLRFIDNEIYAMMVCKLLMPYVIQVSQLTKETLYDNYKLNIIQTTDTLYYLGKTT